MSSLSAYQQTVAKQEAKLERAELLAFQLIDTHLPNTCWQFAWHDRIRALGTCNYRKQEIALSKRWTLATPWEEVEDTIRHEIAHALAGGKAGHGKLWQEKAVLVGAKPQTLYDGPVRTRDVAPAKYEMIDTTTGRVIKSYYRKPSTKMLRSMPYRYIEGRKEETSGKLVIKPVCQLKELNL